MCALKRVKGKYIIFATIRKKIKNIQPNGVAFSEIIFLVVLFLYGS